MNKGRTEAFSDGVLAIIITIMVLELVVPEGHELADLFNDWPKLLAYVVSFLYVGLYWNNHHHMFQAVKRVSGAALWGNLHLLFWLSLLPWLTAWVGESHFAPTPISVYAFDLVMCGVAFTLLQRALIRADTSNTLLARAVQGGTKEKVSTALYIVAILLPLLGQTAAYAAGILLLGVGLSWVVPDPRIERVLAEAGGSGE
ncbi:TMEM175 family protein [Deinococcus marmoris]|uniref:Integral membrane protein n=1 Tax=Deinococcus marmoris TaxID=249408 RepID=A0A1U7NWC9_9DEIO|nr:TMEM175 family protein [Deinococcus marmoris]OLV17207.1 Integral membrane protein [Deinococcus marmoris]